MYIWCLIRVAGRLENSTNNSCEPVNEDLDLRQKKLYFFDAYDASQILVEKFT